MVQLQPYGKGIYNWNIIEIVSVCCLDMYLSVYKMINLDMEFLEFVGRFKRKGNLHIFPFHHQIPTHVFQKYHIYRYKEMNPNQSHEDKPSRMENKIYQGVNTYQFNDNNFEL